jgi:hypothetical protein
MKKESDLVKGLSEEVVFETLVFTRKVTKVDSRDVGDGVIIQLHFDVPVDENATKWLKSNALFKVKYDNCSFPAYVFFGSNGTLCALYPRIKEIQVPGALATDGEHSYKWIIHARYQPAGRDLPPEITEALAGLGVEKKK